MISEYHICSDITTEQQVLKWKLTTRRPDGASEHFRLDHRAELGEEGW